MKKLVALSLLSLSLNAFAACEQYFPFGKPRVQGNYTELCRNGYALVYDNAKKIPFLTFEYLTPETIGRGDVSRGISFREDKDIIPAFRSRIKDYERTEKWDRGHLANAQNAGTREAMADTMLLSNIVPQDYNFNRGSWKVLETRIAKEVRRGRSLFVITGALTNKSNETIGNGVFIPTHLFKIVVDKKSGDASAFLMPNETGNTSYRSHKISVSDLLKIINVDVLPLATDNFKIGAGRVLN